MKSLVAACALALSAGLLVAVPVASAPGAAATSNPAPAGTGGVGWGYDYSNQATGSGENFPVPMLAGRGDIPVDATITQVDSTVTYSACAIADGKGYCWARGGDGQLGNGDTADSALPVAVEASGVLQGKTLVDIAMGEDAACALTSDSLLACWGSDGWGQLGDGGANTNSDVPVLVDQSGALSGLTIVDVAASYSSFCAVASNGIAYCWGYGASGRMGGGGTAGRNVPTAVDMTNLGAETFISLAGGYAGFCGITALRAAYCWGENANGELGDGTTSANLSPTAVVINSALGSDVATISMGLGHSCAIRTNGEMACWGNNGGGQLGDGTTVNSNVPVGVVDFAGRAGRPLTDVTANDYVTCVIVDNTDTFCIGSSSDGVLGNGTYDDSSVYLPVLDVASGLNGAHLTALTSLSGTVCATAQTGDMVCWGGNSSGNGARGSALSTLYPSGFVNGGLAAGEVYTQFAPGSDHSCGLTNLGRVWCVGANSYGQLGDGQTSDSYKPVLAAGTVASKTIVSVAAGSGHTCVLDDQGQVYCVGYGSWGQLGDGLVTDSTTWVQSDFTAVPAGRSITSITAGESANCALDSAGAMYCWGYNYNGELGVADNTDRYLPTPVDVSGVLSGKNLVSMQMGYETTCAVDDAGAAYCWGEDNAGSLGNGNPGVDSNIPTTVDMSGLPAGAVFTQIDVGRDQTCGVVSGGGVAGQAYCWGSNSNGQLGTGDTVDQPLPIEVETTGALAGKRIVDVAAGYYGACALDSDGVVYCWGINDSGQSGIGSLIQNESPQAIVLDGTSAVGATFKDITASAMQGFVLAVTGSNESVPSAPTSVGVGARSNGRAVVSWGVPVNEGGSAIGSYVVEFSTSGSGPWSVPAGCGSVGAGLTCTVTGLNQRANYVFRVAAVNDTGQGAWARVWLKRTPSVVIEGRRSDKKASVVIVSGVASGLMSKPVTVRVKARGQSHYASYDAGRVDAAGRFAWSGPALGRTFVSVVIAGTRSNRITIGG